MNKLHSQKLLKAAKAYFEYSEEINDPNGLYPLTIIADRYSGMYSGGKYLAFNCYPQEVPMEIRDTDITCMEYWNTRRELEEEKAVFPLVGKGATVLEAIKNLKNL
jgi:hypothetical protein